MEVSEMLVDLQEVQNFFFEAALATWVGDGKESTISELPASRVLVYERNLFRYVDSYYVSPAAELDFFGETVIWFRNSPVWGMNYGGFYPDNLNPFLKDALRETYERHEFQGGRGPREYSYSDEDSTLVYTNNPSPNYFTSFCGEEYIHDSGTMVGVLQYHGRSLIQSLRR
jgi:hypothetical protein